MPSTTNFGWTTPADTDLVKDGASAIRTLGNGIDTSFVDLKGGTTGQVLSKNSNTDLDFTWVAQDDSNAIQNAIVDAKGDLISATAADTPARLAVGTDGQVLKANSTTATGLEWGSVSGGQLTETTFTSSNASWTIPSGVTGIWALVVGGGAGGGASSTATASNGGAGGGAGQVKEQFFVIAGGDTTLNITVGAGGAGGTAGGKGSNGSTSSIVGNTSATTYVTCAGGGGGGGGAAANTTGNSGACGGGIASSTSTSTGGGGGFGCSACTSQKGLFYEYQSAYGDGAAATTFGITGNAGGSVGQNYGGNGVIVWNRAVAGGGSGSGSSVTAIASNYGGTNRTAVNVTGNNATANTGGGGSGASTNTSTAYAGGNGGSGIVILRYIA